MGEAREAHAVAALDGKLYAVGGFGGGASCSLGGGASCSLERYDPATNAWEAAAPLTTPHDCYMPSPWRRFLCANFSKPCTVC